MAELPVVHDIKTYADVTARRRFTWLADNVAVDLTGWTAELSVGQRGQFVKHLLGAVTLSAGGHIDVVIGPGDLDAGVWRYQLDLTAPSGDITRFVVGTVNVLAGWS